MQIVTDIKLIDRNAWSSFVSQHPDGNIFQTPEMYDVYCDAMNYSPIIVVCQNEEMSIGGVMLGVVQKEYKGLAGKLTARCIVFGGPLILKNDPAVLKIILAAFNKISARHSIYTEIRNFSNTADLSAVFAAQNFKYEEHLNIVLDLTGGKEQLWKQLKKSRKDGIHKAQKSDFKFDVTQSAATIDEFYSLLEISYRHIKLPYPRIDFFAALQKHLPIDSCLFFALKKDDINQIILCALAHKGRLYAFYIGITRDETILRQRPVDLFYWEVIQWCVENGFNSFDWMGAGKPDKEYGVRKFKLEYGGDLLQPGRYKIIHKPWLYKMATLGLKIKQKMSKS